MISFTKSPTTEICRDMSWKAYCGREGISQSWLKLFDRDSGGAPAKAKFYAEHPELRPPPSDAMEDGSCYHAFVLQPDQFDKLYAVCTPSLEAELYAEAQAAKSKAKAFSRSLSTYKAWAESQAAEGRKVISQERENELYAMRAALLENKEIAEYFEGASLEVSAFAGYELPSSDSQFQLKGRFDLLAGDGSAILDLKSCRTAHPREFASQVARLGYDIQAALYHDLAIWNGIKLDATSRCFGFVAQDKDPPYLACVHYLDEDWLRYGRIRYRKILLDLADCIRRNEWPGYENGTLMPPAWLLTEVEALAA